jgi:hypothetical protein
MANTISVAVKAGRVRLYREKTVAKSSSLLF